MKKKLAIYTAIYGDTDILIDPKINPINCDFYCFTNRKGISSKIYKIIYKKPKFPNDPNRSAKYFKMFPHEFFPEYEYSLWIDARSILTNKNIFYITKDLLKENNWAIFKHPDRTSLFEEARACIELAKDAPEIINKQISAYKKAGFKKKDGLVMASFIFRRHSAKDVVRFERQWWEEILKYSKRDQISFPYVAWKTDFNYKVIDEDIYNNRQIKILRYGDRDFMKKVVDSNSKNKIVIYSAQFGNDINFFAPDDRKIGCDFVLFTDNKQIKIKNVDVRYVDIKSLEEKKAIVMYKALSHKFLPEYEYSVWLDKGVKVADGNIAELVLEVLENYELATFKHFERKTLFDEVMFSVESRKYNPYILLHQYKTYTKQNFQEHGLFDLSVIIRKNTSINVKRFNELWWEQLQKFTPLDQISFPYVLWKRKIDVYIIPASCFLEEKFFEIKQVDVNDGEISTNMLRVYKLKELFDYIIWRFKSLFSFQ